LKGKKKVKYNHFLTSVTVLFIVSLFTNDKNMAKELIKRLLIISNKPG